MSRQQRIEPKLDGESVSIDELATSPRPHHHSTPNKPTKPSFDLEKLMSLFQEHVWQVKRIRIALLAVISIIVLTIIILLSVGGSENKLAVQDTVEPASVEIKLVHDHRVDFDDNFSLFASQFTGLILHWKADQSVTQTLWDIEHAEGDQNCGLLDFNKGDDYRTTKVYVENGQDYYANFSPLDTRMIVKDIARRGSFKLCGYKFSLKGSQATLGKHYFYSDYLLN